MKKELLILGMVFFLNTKSQELRTDCKAPSGSTVLGYQDVVKYVTNYHYNQYGSLENHTKVMYISDTALLFLDQFFNARGYEDYFCFCLYLITYNSKMSSHQKKDDQTYLYLAPVYAGIDSLSDFEVLNDYYKTVKNDPRFKKKYKMDNAVSCYGTCDSSINKWVWKNATPLIGYNRLRESVMSERARGDMLLLANDRITQLDNRENYIDRQGSELYGLQTQRIYFDKHTILKLASFIKDGNNLINYPMIGIYFMSYNEFSGTAQAHPNQTTVAFIPMRKMNNGTLEPDVCTYIEYYNQQVKNKDKIFMFAENHGTLCPTQCPSGGD